MSQLRTALLRSADTCFTNQRTLKSLNAFVTQPGGEVPGHVQNKDLIEADRRWADGLPDSPIDGLLVAVKDNICTTNEPTTCASAMLQGFRSPYPATVIERLRAARALIAGKTNMDEFGMGTYSTNSVHGPVKNVYTQDGEALSAGGSSGGSAVAVATGQCNAALGTDTGGSVRLPAAYTGIVGFKPSYGMVSRYGIIAYANSMDTVGIFAGKSSIVKDIYNVIRGPDMKDPTSLSAKTLAKIAQRVNERNVGLGWGQAPSLRIGVPKEYNTEEMQLVVREAWLETLQRLKNMGHTIQSVSLPATKMALSAYYILAPAEASSNLAKYDGVRYGNKTIRPEASQDVLFATTRGEGFGEEVKRRILLGSYSLSAAAIDNYFIQAQKVRRLVQQDFNQTFALQHPLLEPEDISAQDAPVDVILAPTAQSLPPKISSLEGKAPADAYATDVLTVPASLAGLPAMNVPVPISISRQAHRKEPNSVGMQVLGQYGDDDLVFSAAQMIESFVCR